jgi:hypothetical protein
MQSLGKKARKRGQLGRFRCRWKNNFKKNFKEIELEVWTGFIWLRRGTSGGIL